MQFLFLHRPLMAFFFGKPLMGRISVSQIILTIKCFIYSVVNIRIHIIKKVLFLPFLLQHFTSTKLLWVKFLHSVERLLQQGTEGVIFLFQMHKC